MFSWIDSARWILSSESFGCLPLSHVSPRVDVWDAGRIHVISFFQLAPASTIPKFPTLEFSKCDWTLAEECAFARSGLFGGWSVVWKTWETNANWEAMQNKDPWWRMNVTEARASSPALSVQLSPMLILGNFQAICPWNKMPPMCHWQIKIIF